MRNLSTQKKTYKVLGTVRIQGYSISGFKDCRSYARLRSIYKKINEAYFQKQKLLSKKKVTRTIKTQNQRNIYIREKTKEQKGHDHRMKGNQIFRRQNRKQYHPDSNKLSEQELKKVFDQLEQILDSENYHRFEEIKPKILKISLPISKFLIDDIIPKLQYLKKAQQIQKQQKQELLEKIQRLKIQLREKEEELTKNIQQTKLNLNKKDQQIHELKRSTNTAENQNKMYHTKFYCNIMQDQYIYQEYLTQVLNKFIGKNIKFTKLLYQWNPLHKTRIHQYILHIPHIVFVIQTEDDYHIAAYTQQPFAEKIEPGKGAIISLTNRRSFPSKPGVRAINYDRHFIYFGNTELQIRDNQITSILGTAGGKYQSGSQRADILFGRVEKAKTTIAAMEVFQLVF